MMGTPIARLLDRPGEVTDSNNDIPRACQRPDQLKAAILDIVRTPLCCESAMGTNPRDIMCGKETVPCPVCHRESGVCQYHLLIDLEYHPEVPGVCPECYCTPTAECDVLEVR